MTNSERSISEVAVQHPDVFERADASTELATMKVQFFLLLVQLCENCLWPAKAVLLHLVIDFVQPVAFVLNERWEWSPVLSAISKGVYTFLLPYWDPQHVAHWGRVASRAAFWVVVSVTVIMVVGLFALRKGKAEDILGGLFLPMLQCLVHLLSTVLLMPAANLLLSLMVCNRDSRVWTDPDQPCWDTTHFIHLVMGIAALTVLYLMALVIQTMLFHHSPVALHRFARAHSFVELCAVIYRLVTPVLYHCLLAAEREQLFASLHAVLSLSMALLVATTQPFYNLSTNVTYVTSYLFTACVAGMAAPTWKIYHEGYDTGIVLCFALLCWFTAVFLVKHYRVSSQCLTAIQQAALHLPTLQPENGHPIFPSGLPWDDMRWSQYAYIEDHLRGMRVQNDESSQILWPYIWNVLLPTDVELSTRFLREYVLSVNRSPTPKMMMYAARVFTKGMVKYPDSSAVKMHFIFFLHYYCGTSSIALKELREMERSMTGWVEQFQLFQLEGWLKSLLKIRDESQFRVYKQAQVLHKQTLGLMCTFWSKLLSEHFDTLDLAHLGNNITEKREECLRLFEKARFDTGVAMRYAQFLEEVMLDHGAAKYVREEIVQLEDATNVVKSNIEKRQMLSGNEETASKNVKSLSWSLNIIFFLFLLVIIGFGVLDTVLATKSSDFIDQMHHAGQVRTLAQYGGYIAIKMHHESAAMKQDLDACRSVKCTAGGDVIRAPRTTECTSSMFTTTMALRTTLQQVVDQLRESHNELTFGSLQTSYSPLQELYRDTKLEITVNTAQNTTGTELTGLWLMGSRIIATLEDVVRMEPVCMGQGQHLDFLEENINGHIDHAFNISLQLYEQQNVHMVEQFTLATIVLFVTSLVIILVVYLVLSLNFLKIGVAKIAILSLFTLIPKNTLESIYVEANERLLNFSQRESGEGQGGETSAEEDPDVVPKGFKSLAYDRMKGEGRVIRHITAEEAGCEPQAEPNRSSESSNEEEETQAQVTARPESVANTLEERIAPDTVQLDGEETIELRNSKNQQDAMKRKWRLNIGAGLALAFSIVTLVVMLQYFDRAEEECDDVSKYDRYMDSKVEYQHVIEDLTRLSRQYTTTCGRREFAEYVDLHYTKAVEKAHKEVTQYALHEGLEVALRIKEIRGKLQRREFQAMALARSGCNDTASWMAQFDGGWPPVDSSLSNEEKLSMARKEVFGKEYHDLLQSLDQEFSLLHEDSHLPNEAWKLAVVSLVSCGVMLVALQATPREAPQLDVLTLIEGRSFTALSWLAMVFAIASLIVTTVGMTMVNELHEVQDVTTLNDAMRLKAKVDDSRVLVGEVLFSYPDRGFYAYDELLAQGTFEALLQRMSVLDLSNWENGENKTRKELHHFLARQVEGMRHLEKIALTLAAWYHKERDVSEPFTRWNFTAEADHSRTAVLVGDGLWYTDNQRDFALERSSWYSLAMRILFLEPYEVKLRTAMSMIDSILQVAQDTKRERIKDTRHRIELLGVLATVTATTTLVLMLLFMVVLLAAHARKKTFAGSLLRKQTARPPDSLFSGLAHQVRFSLLVVTALLVVLFGVSMAYLSRTSNMGPTLNRASSRGWLTVRSMSLSQRLSHSTRVESQAATQSRLYEAVEEMREGRDKLYFGLPGESGFPSIPKDSEIAREIFGSDTSTVHYMQCSPVDPPVLGGDGVDIETRSFATGLSHSRFIPSITDRLSSDLHLLLENLSASTALFEEQARKEIDDQRFVFIMVLVLVALLLLVEYTFIFRPMVTKIIKEEEGTKLMLKMIPVHVQESVTAISEYLETGKISQNQWLTEVNEAVTQISTVPTVVSDAKGTIIRFTRAATDVFEWDEAEVVGQSVKLLMPEEIAKHHDYYMQRYRRTAVKHLVGSSRKSRGMRKDGSVFPVKIFLKEYRQGKKSIFIAFLNDITVEIATERAAQLDDAVSMTTSVPVVCATEFGTIKRWNRAASEAFGYDTADIIGQNVKKLMPRDIARNHDTYLSRYRRTGVKTVIDQKIRQRALRKNDEIFPVELYVKEVQWKNGRKIFIAYIRDITEEFKLKQGVMMNDCIVEISPIPLVILNTLGIVQRFSPAAERAWGYSVAEVQNKNVKMLMPDEVAVKHDGYLATYRRTGRKHVIDTARKAEAKRKDGTIFPVELTVREVKSTDTNFPSLYVGFLRDITQSLIRDDKIRLSSVVADLSPIPIITMDTQGIVRSFSLAAVLQTGYEKQEIIGNKIQLIQPRDVAEKHDMYLERYLRTGQKMIIDTTRRVKAKRKDGRCYPTDIAIKEVVTDLGKIFVGYMEDVTNIYHMQQANNINDCATDLCTVPIIAIDANGQILIFSKAAKEIFQYSIEEVLNNNVKMLMPDEYASKHDEYLATYRRTRVQHVIGQVRRVAAMKKDGDTFPANISVREISLQNTESTFVAYVRDITEELELQSERLVQETIVQMSPTPFVAISIDGIICTFSASACTRFGFSLDEAIGSNVKMLMPDEVAEQHDKYLKSYAKTRIKTVIDTTRAVTAKTKNGVLFPAEITIREITLKDALDNQSDIYAGYIRDMTEQYILQQANSINQAVTDLAVIPMISITITGKILQFSKSAEEYFGWESTEVVGKNVKMIMPDDVAQQHDTYLTNYRKTGKKHVIDTTRVVKAKKRDGTIFPAEISVRELERESQNSIFVGYVRDVTQIYALQDEMQRAASLVKLSMIPLISIDIKGTVDVFNEAAQQKFGFRLEEVRGKNIKMLMPPDIAAMHDGYLRSYAKTGVKNVIGNTRTVTGMTSMGMCFPLEITVRELHPEGKNGPPIFVGFARDVTDHIRMQQTAAINDTITDLLVAPTIIINHAGTIERASLSAFEEFGFSKEELMGNNVSMLMPPEVACKHDGYLAAYLRTGKKTVIDSTRKLTAKRKDGSLFPAELCVREVRREGQLPVFVGYCLNLEPEQQLAKNRELTDMVIKMAPMTLIGITTKGTIFRSNHAAERLFGWSIDELIGQNIKMLMPANIAAEHDRYLERYLETRQKTVIDTTRHVKAMKRGGEIFAAEITVREVQVEGIEAQYIGFVKEATGNIQLLREHSVSDAVTAMSPVPIITITDHGIITKASLSAVKIYGYHNELEMLNKNVNILMPMETAMKHDGYLETYRRTREKHIIDTTRQLTAITRTGEPVPVEVSIREVTQEDGSVSFVGYTRDLRPEIEAENLRSTMDLLNDEAPVPVVVIDMFGKIQKANQRALTFFGYGPDELFGENVKILMPTNIAKDHDMFLERYRITRIKHVLDTTRRVTAKKKNGTHVAVQIMIKELNLVGKKAVFVGSITDLTDTMKLEALANVNNILLDLCGEALVCIDSSGRIIRFNPCAEKLFCCRERDVMGKNIKVLMPKETADEHDGYLSNYMRTGIRKVIGTKREVVAQTLDGTKFDAILDIQEIEVYDEVEQASQSYFVGFILR